VSVEIQLDVEGIEQFRNKMARLESGLQRQVYHQLHRLGALIKNLARKLCPVRTGRLRSSIFSQVEDWMLLVGAKAPYAVYVEFGTRYIQPRHFLSRAIKTYVPQLERLIGESVDSAVREASK